MKIRIELDVAPDEVPLTTELLSVLRGLTDHVSVNTNSAASFPQQAPLTAPLPGQTTQMPAAAAASPAAHLYPQAPLTAMPAMAPLPGAANNAPVPSAPPPQLAAAPAPVPTLSLAAAAAAPSAAAAAPRSVQPLQFPPGTTTAHMFEHLMLAAEQSPHPENVDLPVQEARQLESIFLNSSLGQPLELVREFSAVWKRVALDPQLLQQERSAYPFVALLAQFNRELMARVRDMIMEDLMKHLTAKRAIDVDRAEFYVHAEAFAALASFEIIALEGAVTTMAGTMIKKPGSRAAAVTMLGKTVDLASQLILDKCSEKTLTLMRTNISGLEEEEFQYDKSFILECMGWATSEPSAAAHDPAGYTAAVPYGANGAVQPQLHAVQSCPAHTEMVFALAMDTVQQQVVSGGRDAFLQVWTEEGRAVQRLDLQDKYVSTMDFHPKLGMLLATCVSRTNNYPIYIGGYSSLASKGFAAQGFIQRPHTSQISCVRALPETAGFISSETALGPQGQRSQDILYWDVGAGGGFASLQPVSTYRGNTDIVTTMARVPDEPNMFLSGAKDAFVHLWDVRTQHSVASLGEVQADGGVRAHASMITCLESFGHLLFSGSADRTVKVWDLRRVSPTGPAPPLATLPVDNMVVLKVAANASCRLAAVSAMNGLYLLDFAHEAEPTLRRAEYAWPGERKPQAYHDIRWSEDKGLLFAGGKDAMLDMYALA